MFLKYLKNKKLFSSSNLLELGILSILISLATALVAYYTYFTPLLYLSFIILSSGIILLFLAMGQDIHNYLKSPFWSFFIPALLFLVYFIIHLNVHHFDFFLADASDYYLSGINSITNHQDMGFFLPLTAAISAVGFQLFSYDYTPFIMVIFYASSIPLSYFILQYLIENTFVSITVSTLILFSPLAIWFPKSTYSESLWQIQILILIILSIHISIHLKPTIVILITLILSTILLPFTRGEATLIYAVILFLSTYHIWKFKTLMYPIIISFSMIFLAIGVHLTLQSRAHYLLTWQYHRIIPNVTETQLMTILYIFSIFTFFFILLIYKFKNTLRKINLFIVITILAILSKISIAYVYMHKSNPLFHSFNFINEYGFALGNFGLPISILIGIGLILLHIQAMRSHIISLILVIFYAIFYLPFAMQAVQFSDIHEIFLYWNRYYFSFLMMLHLYALGITLKLIYNFIAKILPKAIYCNLTFIFFITVLFLSSLNLKLIALTIEESYLENSQKLMPWVAKHIGSNPLSIIYDETITFGLHHNRNYDAKILTYRTFPVAKINTKTYLKINSNELNSSIKINQKIIKTPYVLCLSTYPCKINAKDALFIDSIILPISWRENYGIDTNKDSQIHHNITQSIHHSLTLHASLYKLKEKFEYGKEIRFKRSSSLSATMLNHQWQFPKAGIGALTRDKSTKLLIQNIPKKKDISYRVDLRYVIFNASDKSPQTLSIYSHNHLLKQIRVTSSRVHTISFTIPTTLLSSYTDKLTSIIKVQGLKKTNHSTLYKLYLKSIKITPLLHKSIQKTLAQ